MELPEYISSESILRLIRTKLGEYQNAGDELISKYNCGLIALDDLNTKIKEIKGYNLWWGLKSSWYPIDLVSNSTGETGDSLIEIKSKCIMERISSTNVAGFDINPQRNLAEIIIMIDNSKEIKLFDFKWL